MKKRNSNTSLIYSKDNEVSIQFSLDGFSFCISNLVSSKSLYFSEYEFEKKLNTPEELLLKIEEIFKMDANLQQDFAKVTIIHQNNLSTLVPDAFFEEDKLDSYLNYTIKTLATDFITFDSLPQIEAKNVYIPYVNINNYLFHNFGEFEYKHHSTILIEKYITHNTLEDKVMYVNVSNNSLHILVLHNKNVLLSNSFNYKTKEDFIYYILFVAEQLQLNTETYPLYFTGNISLEDELYTLTYKYIKNCYFLESKNSIFKNLDIPKHKSYILLGS